MTRVGVLQDEIIENRIYVVCDAQVNEQNSSLILWNSLPQ